MPRFLVPAFRKTPPAIGRRLIVACTLLMAGVLAVLPLAHASFPDAPVLLFMVPIGLCAVRFGLLGGLASAAVGVAVATIWLVHGQGFVHGMLDFSIHSVGFLLVGGLVGAVASQRERLKREIARHNELSLDLICTASFDGYFTKLNPAWEQTLGYPLHEPGQPVLSFQNRYRHADGSYRWLEWTSRPRPAGAAAARGRPRPHPPQAGRGSDPRLSRRTRARRPGTDARARGITP